MSETESCCKVGAVAAKYRLSPGVTDETLDEQLANRWDGTDGYPEMSIRELVDWLHKHMLRTRYTEQGRSTLEPHLDSDYDVLSNEADDNHRAVLSDLAGDGIDGEALLEDFVSPATMYRHLTGCLDVEKDAARGDSANPVRNKLSYVENTVETHVADLLSAWENSGDVPAATEADVAVRIYLECPTCSKQTGLRIVQQRGYVCEEHLSSQSGPPTGT